MPKNRQESYSQGYVKIKYSKTLFYRPSIYRQIRLPPSLFRMSKFLPRKIPLLKLQTR